MRHFKYTILMAHYASIVIHFTEERRVADLLKVEDLYVSVAETEILHGVNLEVNPGETHVIMGPNGAGKSTLGYSIMGNPNYEVGKGKIYFTFSSAAGIWKSSV